MNELNVLTSKHVILIISKDKDSLRDDNANLDLSIFVGAMSYKCSALRHGQK